MAISPMLHLISHHQAALLYLLNKCIDQTMTVRCCGGHREGRRLPNSIS